MQSAPETVSGAGWNFLCAWGPGSSICGRRRSDSERRVRSQYDHRSHHGLSHRYTG